MLIKIENYFPAEFKIKKHCFKDMKKTKYYNYITYMNVQKKYV